MSNQSNLNNQPQKTFSFTNAFFLLGIPAIAIAMTPWAYKSGGLTTAVFIYAFIHYFVEGLAITAGYHRLFAHRSYKANPLVRFFVLFLGAGAMQNSALMWAHDHRIHHRHEDTEKDPYNIKKGFWWAHMGWIFFASNSNWAEENAPSDLKADKLVMWQHRNYLLIALVSWMGIPLLFGLLFDNILGFFVVGALWRVLWTSHCTYLINSAAHCFGKATYTLKLTAKDNWFLAFFTFGEGYHNFHHKFQADYRNGFRWWHYDPTKWLIGTLNFFGMTSQLNRTPEEKILLAQMRTKQKLLENEGINTQSLEALTLRMESILEDFRKLKQSLEAAKKRGYKRGNEMVTQVMQQIEDYKTQRENTYKQWMTQFRSLRPQ
ncbi:acyl-CoA desaturase [bacterium]|nr:acyl-CoA desaturase [bacterium]